MLDSLSTAMGFEYFFSKSQLSLVDYELLEATEIFQDLWSKFKELERKYDPT